MILDSAGNIHLYKGVAPDLEPLMEYALSLKDAPAGRYEMGEHYVLIQTPVTRGLDGAALEAHRAYIDVQVLLEGEETVRWAPLDALRESAPYDASKDMLLAEGEGCDLMVKAGMFYLLFPGDAHAPLGCVGMPGAPLRKAVIKLKIK